MFSKEIHYSVVRFMLNELGDEAANVALVAVTNDFPPRLIAKTHPNPAEKSRVDSKVQADAVERFMAHVESVFDSSRDSGTEAADSVFEQLRERASGLLRITSPRSVITNDVDREIEVLFGQLIAKPAPVARMVATMDAALQAKREPTVRDPLGGLRREANSALVQAFRSGYGHPLRKGSYRRSYAIDGAKHKSTFDFAFFTPRGRKTHEHVFQHVLLLPDAQQTFNQAAGLSVRWADVQEKNGAHRDLRAVLFSRPGKTAGTAEAARLLEESNIEVVPLKRLPEVAHKLAQQLQLDIRKHE